MVFGLFGRKKGANLIETNNNVNALPLVFKALEDKFDAGLNYCRELKESKENLEKRVEILEKALAEHKKQIESFVGDTSIWLYDADVRIEDFEKYKKENAVYLASHDMKIKNLQDQIENVGKDKSPKKPESKIKIPTTQAILNILGNKKTPLDFDYIFDNIKKYDLKQKNPSPERVKRSIYNLVYNGKVACGKKRGTYQICESPTKH